MPSSTRVWVTALLCLTTATAVQAAWGYNKAVTTAASPVQSYVPPPAPAATVEDPVHFSDMLDHDEQPASPAAPTTRPGFHYKLGPIKFYPADFQLEAYLLASILGYTLLSLLGGASNKSHAKAWMDANAPTLQGEFAGVGLGDVGKTFAEDGGDEFWTYATGRRGVISAWTKVQTKSRHDPLTTVYRAVRGVLDYGYVSGEDRITIDFKLKPPQGTPGARFVFAAADRRVLRLLRDSRWDLTTFTTPVESLKNIDDGVIVMSENGEVTKALLQHETGLAHALRPGAPLEWFESLVVSDGVADIPSVSNPFLPEDDIHLILTLRLPTKHRSAETAPWISLACNIADVLYQQQKLLPEVQVTKLKKRRAEVLAGLVKAAAEEQKLSAQEQKEQAAVLKRKLEKEKEEAKLRTMSRSERIKYLAKQEEAKRKETFKKLSKKQK